MPKPTESGDVGSPPPLLRAEAVVKTYPGVTALDGVDFGLDRGQIHALVGENGAGKSTLINVLSGACRKDAGVLRLDGGPVDFFSPQDAQRHGVVAVHQEIQVLPARTVAENICLGREPTRWGLIDRRRVRAEAITALARLGADLDPDRPLASLSIGLRQLVAIARGLALGGRVLILDEPTSALTEREVEVLFAAVRRLRPAGVGVVYVSHRLDELYALCDYVTVLRDGRRVAHRPMRAMSRLELVSAMLGKRSEPATKPDHGRLPAPPASEPHLLRARGLATSNHLAGVTVTVRGGEVVGLAGLLGSGRTETFRALFGLDRLTTGDVEVGGTAAKLRGPRDAIRAGLALVPEDRKADGTLPDRSVLENMTIAALPLTSRFGVLLRARQREVARAFVSRLRIRVSSIDQPMKELSGGNQQKVLLARWLCRHPRLLLLDDPNRGVDVGAKAEILGLIREMAHKGLGVLIASSELEELLEVSTSVVVLRDGRSVTAMPCPDGPPDDLIHLMAGSVDDQSRAGR